MSATVVKKEVKKKISKPVKKNNQGKNALILTADVSIAMGSDTATSTLGLVSGLETSRNATFFTHNGPIVDGTNGGVAVVAAGAGEAFC